MEKLLNKLIEKGWKPFGTKNKVFKVMKTKNNWWYFDGGFGNEICFSLRELTSKESGLWQFVCENELYPQYIQHRWFRDLPKNGLQPHDYRYWVIESVLCDEDKLEQFLLDNIKIDG